jgi:hypothetical protein
VRAFADDADALVALLLPRSATRGSPRSLGDDITPPRFRLTPNLPIMG